MKGREEQSKNSTKPDKNLRISYTKDMLPKEQKKTTIRSL